MLFSYEYQVPSDIERLDTYVAMQIISAREYRVPCDSQMAPRVGFMCVRTCTYYESTKTCV